MKYCTGCGRMLKDDERFCTACGTPAPASAAGPAAAPAAPAPAPAAPSYMPAAPASGGMGQRLTDMVRSRPLLLASGLLQLICILLLGVDYGYCKIYYKGDDPWAEWILSALLDGKMELKMFQGVGILQVLFTALFLASVAMIVVPPLLGKDFGIAGKLVPAAPPALTSLWVLVFPVLVRSRIYGETVKAFEEELDWEISRSELAEEIGIKFTMEAGGWILLLVCLAAVALAVVGMMLKTGGKTGSKPAPYMPVTYGGAAPHSPVSYGGEPAAPVVPVAPAPSVAPAAHEEETAFTPVFGGFRPVAETTPVYAPEPEVYAPPAPVYAPEPEVYAPPAPVYAPEPEVYAPPAPVYAPEPAPYAPPAPVYTPEPAPYAP